MVVNMVRAPFAEANMPADERGDTDKPASQQEHVNPAEKVEREESLACRAYGIAANHLMIKIKPLLSGSY